ncbi:MAG: DUF2314 domain-containing protein [Deltaproteobacteria bacterium]|nr:DUF2314 domain-containing protein [Deltaproteobacteria bacterium]
MRVVLMVGGLAACARKEPEGAAHAVAPSSAVTDAAEPKAAVVGLGPVRGDAAESLLAVYYLPQPTSPPRAAFDALVKAQPGLHLVTTSLDDGPRPAIMFLEPPIAEFAPPTADNLKYFARGLSPAEVVAVPNSQHVAGFGIASTGADAVAGLRLAHRLAADLAAKTGGVVWSDDQRLVYGAEAWRDRGLALASDPIDVSMVSTIHAYQAHDGEGVRAVTIGLGQVALPDLVIEDAPTRGGVQVNTLLNVVAQTLLEGGTPAADGTLALDIGALKNAAARARAQEDHGEKATGKATIVLRPSTPEEGDAHNRLWQIDFPGTGAYSERMAATSAALFGRTDEIKGASADDAELLAASARAKVALAKLEAGFVKRSAHGDKLIVKAPFKTTSGNNEYMWIEVRTWKGGVLRGVLTDEPYDVPTLHAGAMVEVKQVDVFDYLLAHLDGTTEGGETNDVIERRGTAWPSK